MVQLLGLTTLNTYNKQPAARYNPSDCISTVALSIFDKLGPISVICSKVQYLTHFRFLIFHLEFWLSLT